MAQEPSKVDVVIANHPSFVTNADLETVKVPSALLKGDQDVSAAILFPAAQTHGRNDPLLSGIDC